MTVNSMTSGTLALSEKWSDALNELFVGVFCDRLLDLSMAEYVRRKRPQHLTDCVSSLSGL